MRVQRGGDEMGTVLIRRAKLIVTCAVVAGAIGYGVSWTVGRRPTGGTVISLPDGRARFGTVEPRHDKQSTRGVRLVKQIGRQEIAVGTPLASFQRNTATHPIVASGPGSFGSSREHADGASGVADLGLIGSRAVEDDRSQARPTPARRGRERALPRRHRFIWRRRPRLIFHVGVRTHSVDAILGTGATPAVLEL